MDRTAEITRTVVGFTLRFWEEDEGAVTRWNGIISFSRATMCTPKQIFPHEYVSESQPDLGLFIFWPLKKTPQCIVWLFPLFRHVEILHSMLNYHRTVIPVSFALIWDYSFFGPVYSMTFFTILWTFWNVILLFFTPSYHRTVFPTRFPTVRPFFLIFIHVEILFSICLLVLNNKKKSLTYRWDFSAITKIWSLKHILQACFQ